MTTRDFIYKALDGTTRATACASVFIEDGIVYSYGRHYPLATIIDGVGYVNTTGYSNTTSKHINWAWQALTDLVGASNIVTVKLDGSFYKHDIAQSMAQECADLIEQMDSKKRKDTAVYRELEGRLNYLREKAQLIF